MKDLENRLLFPLEQNFAKINTDRDGYLGRDELAKCQSNAEFSKEVQNSCGIAGKTYDDLQNLTPKEWWRHGISKDDLKELRRDNALFKSRSDLSHLGLANFDVYDSDHTGILDERKLANTPLWGETRHMGHVVSSSDRVSLSYYNSGSGLGWHLSDDGDDDRYGISKSDLESYPKRLLSGGLSRLGNVLNALPEEP